MASKSGTSAPARRIRASVDHGRCVNVAPHTPQRFLSSAHLVIIGLRAGVSRTGVQNGCAGPCYDSGVTSQRAGVVVLLLVVAAFGCSRRVAEPTPAPSATTVSVPTTGGAYFTVAPVDLASVDYINPLGHMTTPFNALPQGRMYLVFRNPSETYPVFAPAEGTIVWINGPKPDYRIQIQVDATFTYFVDHVTLEPGLQQGGLVAAGQRIGAHSGITCCLDFGAMSTQVVAGYANQARYSPESMNADSPIRHFAEPLRSQLYAKVTRVSDGLDGRADYDRPGRLSGNWFLEGTPEAGSLLPENWPRQLAFAYSNTHPSRILVSIAGTLPIVNLCTVQDGAPDPATIGVGNGKIAYQLFQKDPPVSEGDGRGRLLGLMIVQMLDDASIRIEVFPGNAATTAEFTAAARIYTR